MLHEFLPLRVQRMIRYSSGGPSARPMRCFPRPPGDRGQPTSAAPGDTLIVWKLDRLGRSLRDLILMPDDLKERGVKFRSITEAVDTESATGRAMWMMIGVLAELERSLIVERTRAGVTAARARGVKFGRKRKLQPAQVAHARKLINAGEHSRAG